MKMMMKKLKEAGIRETTFNRWKIYNPETYYKMETQAQINMDIAVKNYKNRILNAEKY